MITTSYRPRNPGHDYYGRGTYLITVVVSQRLPLLGRLGNDVKHPGVTLSPLGEAVKMAWETTPREAGGSRQPCGSARLRLYARPFPWRD